MPAVQLLIIFACMFGASFFAGMETGIISIHRMRLRHFVRKGSASARILQGFVLHPDRLLGTTLVGTNICMVVVSVVAASLAVSLLGHWGETVSTVVMSALVLVFSEYLPKAYFHSRPIERTRPFARMLRFWEIVFKPLSKTMVWLTGWLVPGASKTFSAPAPFVTRDDLKVLAREGEKDGVLSPRERVMIHRVMELSGKRAGQIMVPRDQMVFVESDMQVREFFDRARDSGFTRMPVYDREQDKFTGVINVFYVLSRHPIDAEKTVAAFTRPPLLVDERMPVDDIFPRLRRFRQPMCLVTDEAREVAGLLTTEDVLREIVGKL